MHYSAHQARQAEMWGGHAPTEGEVVRLAGAFAKDWGEAVDEMLRHWERPPVGE